MADVKSKLPLKGKKIAGVPVVFLVAGAIAVVGYLWWKHRQQNGSSDTSSQLTTYPLPQGVLSAAGGGTPSTATAPSDNLSSDVLAQLGQQQSDFIAALYQNQADNFDQIAQLLAGSGVGAHANGGDFQTLDRKKIDSGTTTTVAGTPTSTKKKTKAKLNAGSQAWAKSVYTTATRQAGSLGRAKGNQVALLK